MSLGLFYRCYYEYKQRGRSFGEQKENNEKKNRRRHLLS